MNKNSICIARKCYFSCGVERPDSGNSGYNYTFEVFIYGPIDPVTGLVINLTDVNIALSAVSSQVNQKHLNYDINDLSSYDLASIHKYIHQLFLNEFSNICPSHIRVVKTSLEEGLEALSEIILDPLYK